MTSPLIGVWELVSDNTTGFQIFTETHFGACLKRQNGRGFIGTYTVENHHLQETILVDTASDASQTGALAFELDGDILTTTLLTPGTITPAGGVFRLA
jgi:hypothetical protein